MLLAMLMQPVYAQNLCEPDCEFVIDFTDGGSIEAIEALTITFGEGGLINDGIVTTGFAKGEILTLNAGETLLFSPGGELNLGAAGNIDYTSMNLTANGNITLNSPAGGTSSFHGDSIITANDGLVLNSDASLSSDLGLSGNSATLISGSGTITVEPTGSIMADNPIIFLSTPLTVSDVNETLQGTENLDNSTFITQQDLVALEGLSMPTEPGGTCTVSNSQCIDTDGNLFSLVDGKFVVPENNSGSFNPVNLLFLFLVLIFSGFRRSC